MGNLGLGFSQLDKDEKFAYSILEEALKRQQTSCDISKINRSVDIMHVLTIVLGDNPEIIYFNKTMIRTVRSLFAKQLSFSSCLSKKQTEKVNLELKKALEDAVWEIDKHAKDDKEILRGISEYLQRTVTYDRDELNCAMRGKSQNFMAHNAYGALVMHKAVCDGFSSAYSLIAQYFGFKCMIVDGKSSYQTNAKVNHAWNIIEFNGKYFHVDSTWDVNTYEVIHEYSYDYFGLDDDEVSVDHDWDYKTTPKCNSNELSYFVSNNLYAQSESQIEEIIYRCFKRGDKVVRIRISASLPLNGDAETELRKIISKASSRADICRQFNYMWQDSTRCLIIKL